MRQFYNLADQISKLTIAAFIVALTLISCTDETAAPLLNNDVSDAESHRQIVQTVVSSTAAGFSSLFESSITEDEKQKEFCRSYIEDIRFFEDNTGYFFIENMQAVMVAHPINKDVIGESRIDVKDSKGKLYVREMLDSLKASGSGYINYHFKHPNSGSDVEKTAYVQKVDNADLFIGSGWYLEDKNAKITKIESQKRIAKEVVHSAAMGMASVFSDIIQDKTEQISFAREFLKEIRFFNDKTGYFFFYHTDGTCLAHPLQPDIEGVNRIDHKDSKGSLYIKEMCDLMKSTGKGYVEYYKLNFVTNTDEEKISYMEKLEGTDYFIGAGVYLK